MFCGRRNKDWIDLAFEPLPPSYGNRESKPATKTAALKTPDEPSTRPLVHGPAAAQRHTSTVHFAGNSVGLGPGRRSDWADSSSTRPAGLHYYYQTRLCANHANHLERHLFAAASSPTSTYYVCVRNASCRCGQGWPLFSQAYCEPPRSRGLMEPSSWRRCLLISGSAIWLSYYNRDSV